MHDFNGWESLGQLSIGKISKNSAIRFPQKEIIDAGTGESICFKDLDEKANSIANGLLEMGIGLGSPVAVLTGWNIRNVELYFACAKAGLIIIPLSYRLHPREIEKILNHLGARAIVFEDKFQAIVDDLDLQIEKIIIGEASQNFIGYEEFLKYDTREPAIEIKDNYASVLGLTSGTTGTPKCYVRSHYGTFITHLMFSTVFEMGRNDIGLSAIPPLTGLGWICGMMIAGGTPMLMDFDPKTCLQSIEKYKITAFHGVPAMLQAIMAVPGFKDYDVSSLQKIATSGSAIPPPVLEQIWEQLCPDVYDQYGLQETGMAAMITPEMKRIKPSSIGTPPPMHDLKIVDDDGNELPKGQVGEIVIRNAECTNAYWNNEEATSQTFKNGWCHTGDLGKLDDDSYLYLVGRKKDMIISGGYNVYAQDVEDTILRMDAVSTCAVIGLPDEKWGEKVTAVVVLFKGQKLSAEEVIAFCADRVAKYRVPKSVFFVDELPMTASGKIMKYKLIEKFKD